MTHPKRTHAKLLSIGQLFSATPGVRELRDKAQAMLEAGASDNEIRAYARERGQELGMLGPSALFPWLTEEVLDMDMSDLVDELAGQLALLASGKRVGDIADTLWEKIGFDEWLANYVLDWAKTGEPGAYFESFGGKVWSHKLGFGEDKVDTVWCVITPSSHPQELLKQAFEESVRLFLPETFSRYGYNVEAHRVVRMKIEDPSLTYGDIAEILLAEKGITRKNTDKADFSVYKDAERERIEKLADRYWKNYADSFFEYLSADSD